MEKMEKTEEMEKTEAKEAMTREEVAQVNGGDIIDDIGCAFGAHHWTTEEFYTFWDDQGHNVEYLHLVCKNCKKSKYEKEDHTTGKTKTVSKSEYDRYA